MSTNKFLITLLKWIPSLIVTLFFVPNALNKIMNPNETGKIVENSTVLTITGIYLLTATALFLYNKTILAGTTLLAFYMTFITFIHLYKGKPYEVAMLIVMATIFAAHIRKPLLFKKTDAIS